MAYKPPTWIVTLSVIFLLFFAFFNPSEARSPLCNKCNCVSNVDNANITGINVECINASSILDVLFLNSSWIDEQNNSYPIIGVDLQHNNLKNLSTQFCTSDVLALDLSFNAISEIANGIFANLDNLEFLSLSNNELQILDPNVFKGYYQPYHDYPMLNLKTLILSNNKLHSLNQDLFQHTPSIETLILSGNPLKVIDQHTHIAISDLPQLQSLDLSFTQLAMLPDHCIHTPSKLYKLNLTGNNFESVPHCLNDTQSLEVLLFNNNPIRNFTHKIAFPHIKPLRRIFFCNMSELQEIGAHTFGMLNNLREVHVCDNEKLNFIHPSAFNRKNHQGQKMYPPISKLFLHNNNLTHVDRHLLGDWRDLKEFDFSGNPWNCDCVNRWLIYNLTLVSEKYEYGSRYEGVPRIRHTNQFRCASPEKLKGMTLYDLSDQRNLMDCNPPKPASVHSFIIVGIISATLSVLCIVGLLIFLYKKKKITYKKLSNYTYRFRNRPENPEEPQENPTS